jgi:DNA-binding transcriptional LysR family regulator
LSHALARLESEAGEALLERPRPGRPHLTPTAAGKMLAERARRAVGEVRAFADDLSALRGVLRGEVRIGSMQTLNSTILPKPLARFALAHPDVQISLRTLAAEDIPAALAEGHIDVGLIAGAPVQVLNELETRRLCHEELVALVRSGEPLANRRSVPLRHLSEQGFVMVLSGTFTDTLILSACQKAGFVPRVVLRLESGEAIREVVRAGLGITVLPAGYLAKRDPTLRAVRLTQPTPKREVHIAWDRRIRPSAAATAFIEAMKRDVVS